MEQKNSKNTDRFSVIGNVFLFDELLTSPRRLVSNGYSPRLLFLKEYDIFKFYDRNIGKFTIEKSEFKFNKTLNSIFETTDKIELGEYLNIVIRILNSDGNLEEISKNNFLILHGKNIVGVGSIESII